MARIAIPAEMAANETRVAATPETVKKYIALGCDVVVQRGAGDGARFTDAAFEEAGASLADDFVATVKGADVLLKIQPLNQDEMKMVAKGTVVASLHTPFNNPLLEDYNTQGLTSFCMEMIPRTSRAQSMDVLSSQANIAGYKAVLLALEHYQKFMPMLMTAAGTVQSAKVLVMGAGVAGLQAIATARRLGAMVEAFDVRAAAKEQVESLGAKFVEVPQDEDAEDAGGYAKEMSDEYKQKQAELIAEHAAKSDIIITTALIPGRAAPVLITEETVTKMKQGAVIVDMAVEAGGNCPLSKKDEVYTKDGITFVGVSNIPATLATDASALYAKNMLNFMGLMLDKETGALNIDREDDIIQGALLCMDGEFLKPDLLKGGA
ncbi:MAG TPA: Re/Si-specific NAD(P)(+) transhydrogenase subunit alpha [Ghiorsea sp.]|nr:Re/Si-specific NAD(P)(+) transhydrogenase subunit alpha [Ghiorsea sp.]HIP07268.1 Re/Si-specific NAD(P)(+) transhydrogenase subunit alpha [Mariprofundaceae bacterium]